jgi:hypothetical protein
MTHGDKAKAKTGKSSQASAAKKSSPKAAGKGAESKTAGKAAKAREKGSQPPIRKGVPAKSAPAPEKGGSRAGKEARSEPKAKARPVPEDAGTFSNPAVGTAFKHVLKKYPNALRKLTD